MTSLEQVSRKIDSLSGAHKRLGQYILNDSSVLLLSNGKDLARAVGVSEATVVRFAKILGYRGFPELKRQLQKEARPRLRATERMKQTMAELGKDENVIAKLIKRDIQLLQETVQALSLADFRKSFRLASLFASFIRPMRSPSYTERNLRTT